MGFTGTGGAALRTGAGCFRLVGDGDGLGRGHMGPAGAQTTTTVAAIWPELQNLFGQLRPANHVQSLRESIREESVTYKIPQ